MSSILRFLLWSLMAAATLVACDMPASPQGEGGDGGHGGDTGPQRVSIMVSVFEFDPTVSPPRLNLPMEGTRICELDSDNCVTTDSDGFAVIELPAFRETGFTADKDGYGSWLFPNVTDDRWPPPVVTTVPMMTHASLAAISEDLQTPYPWEKGIVALQKWSIRAWVPMQSARFVPIGPTADAVGAGFYLDVEAIRYSLELEETAPGLQTAEMPLAQGGFVEVEPGVHQFELSGVVNDCYFLSWGWPADAPNRIRIPVRAGYRTYGSMRCEDSH